MSLAHLQGKRSGRPRGSRSAPAWLRAARWASENLDDANAVPPTPLAGRLLAMGREHPDRLAVCLAKLSAMERAEHRRLNRAIVPTESVSKKAEGPTESPRAEQPDLATKGDRNGRPGSLTNWLPDDDQLRRVKQVRVSEALLFGLLRSGNAGWARKAPFDARVVGCIADPSRREVCLIVRSQTFPEVAHGEPVPELEMTPPEGYR